MKLVLATQNKNKLIELKRLLKDYPQYEVVSLAELNVSDDVEETGNSFEANARLKALYYFHKTGYVCLADDSGIEIEALNNEPGIYSARYLGEDTPYHTKNQMILERLKDVNNRKARFVSVVTLVLSENEIYSFEGIMPGSIAYALRGHNGFGYDPIFIPEGHNLTYAEMEIELKNKLSHRGQAFRKAVIFLEKRNNNEK